MRKLIMSSYQACFMLAVPTVFINPAIARLKVKRFGHGTNERRRYHMIEKLKPCPFCGSHNISIISCSKERENKSAWKSVEYSYYVECDYCRVRTDSYVVRFDAVSAWEARS